MLHPDGRVTPVPGFTFDEGTWKGDAIYFEVTIGSLTITYSRLAKQ